MAGCLGTTAAAAARMEQRSLQAEAQAKRHAEVYQQEMELQAAQLATLKEQLQATVAAAVSQRTAEASAHAAAREARAAVRGPRRSGLAAAAKAAIYELPPGARYHGPIVPQMFDSDGSPPQVVPPAAVKSGEEDGAAVAVAQVPAAEVPQQGQPLDDCGQIRAVERGQVAMYVVREDTGTTGQGGGTGGGGGDTLV